jgi:hypothetical protein
MHNHFSKAKTELKADPEAETLLEAPEAPEAEAPEAESPEAPEALEAEALETLALPHHWT